MLLRQIAEPDHVLSVDWLEVAIKFADHFWVYKLLNSGQCSIYDGLLEELARRSLDYPSGCTKIEECDVFALPSWNECSWSDGHVLAEFLNNISEVQFHRMIPHLLRDSSGFGFSSPEIFSLLLSKASAECLQTWAEDLLVRLIRDSFHQQSMQRFGATDLSTRCGFTWIGPVILTCFDPSFVDAQRQKLACFVDTAVKLGSRVDLDECLLFCCQFGDAPRAQIVLSALGSISQLDSPRFVAATLRQQSEDRKAPLLKLFGCDSPQNKWFFRELFHFISPLSVFLHLPILFRIEKPVGLQALMVWFLSLSFYVGVASVAMRMLQFSGRWPLLFALFSCVVPFVLNAYALFILKCPFIGHRGRFVVVMLCSCGGKHACAYLLGVVNIGWSVE